MMGERQRAWYERVRRWGQTNLTEEDPAVCDVDWWRAHWRRTRVQGVIVNAGGIVAYYPSGLDLHYRAEKLGERDLLGELVAAARAEGLAVLARMDSNRADEAFYRAHPGWFAVDADGEPCRTQGRYQACVNGPYYREWLPEVLREVIRRYEPDGFGDNSWTGMGRRWICHCEHCARGFRDAEGLALPRAADWTDEAYRRWVRWSYETRLAIWDLNNRVAREAGGEDCLWLGMVNGDPVATHVSFCDLRRVGEGAAMLLSDQQSRTVGGGFEGNAVSGKLLHGVAGWDRLVPESMAMYVRGEQTFRRASTPAAEARLWMAAGFAGGVSPWWHHVGAHQEDRRQFETAGPMMRWHEANESYLYEREPMASVGLVWSHENGDFYGRDRAAERVELPWRGWVKALVRARIGFVPVHADHVAREAARLDVVVLPDLAAMTESQVAGVRAFAAGGGSVVATGRTSLLDEWGEAGGGFALEDVLGVRATGAVYGVEGEPTGDWEVQVGHTYLRLPAEGRHEIVAGFEGTDILAFGGTLIGCRLEGDADVVATLVPAFPIYPPEFSWMRERTSDVPAIVAREAGAGGRVVYLAADVDRCYARRLLPDHGELLASAVRWAVRGRLPMTVEGPGYLDCHLYRQEDRLVLHVVNLTGCDAWPGYVEACAGVGPVSVGVRLPEGCGGAGRARLLVAGGECAVEVAGGEARMTIDRITDHEVIVIE
jgi:hypothetical protein